MTAARDAYLARLRSTLDAAVARLVDPNPATTAREHRVEAKAATAALADIIRTVDPALVASVDPDLGTRPGRITCPVCGRGFVPTVEGRIRRHERGGRPCPGSRTRPTTNTTEGPA